MAVSKKTDSSVALKSKAVVSICDRLALAQSIKELCQNGEKFVNALEHLKTFDEQKLNEIDMKISAQMQHFQDLKLKLEAEYKNNCIATKQQLEEFKLAACEEIVKPMQKMIVEIDVYQNLKKTIEEMQDKHDVELHNVLEQKETNHKNNVVSLEKILKLQQTAEQAKLISQVEQQEKEIQVLKDTIKMQLNELKEQRSLTKSVADAGSRAQITQSIGKQ